MQRGFAAIERVEVPHQPLHPGMARIVQRAPVELGVVVPFAGLRELLAHEQQLLARMPPHEPVIGPQVGEFLPAPPGILPSIEPLPCTTSSWLIGRMKFSVNA
jgi:hypothetical protein